MAEASPLSPPLGEPVWEVEVDPLTVYDLLVTVGERLAEYGTVRMFIVISLQHRRSCGRRFHSAGWNHGL